MALGLAVNARGADHNRSGAYEADSSGQHDRRLGGEPHVRGAIETEDRAAVYGLVDPVQIPPARVRRPDVREWAQLLNTVTGWDVDGDELEQTARRIVMAKRLFNVREGWTREEDGLPDRSCRSRWSSSPAGTATLSAEPLEAMIDSLLPRTRSRSDTGLPTPGDCWRA